MPSIRIGFSTDFNLTGEQIGIGTTNPTARLDVAGQIRSDDSAGSGGVSTVTRYSGFLDEAQGLGNNVSIAETTKGNLNSLSGEIKISGEVTVTEDTKLTGGRLDSLTVTGKFDLPHGGTEDREDTPEKGSTRFNQDLGQLEFYTGYEWRTVNSYADIKNSPSGRGRAVFAGGAAFAPGTTQYATIDFVNIQSLGNTSYFGELLTADSRVGGCASSTRGLFAGGFSPANNDDIDYITLSSEGNGIDFGNLTQARQTIAGCSSSTRGVWNGGRNPGAVDTIDYNEIATLGNALDFGDLTTNKREWPQAVSSPTRGVIASGEILTNLDTIIMSSKGNAVEYGDLTKARGAVGALGNSVRGVFAGGNPIVPTIDYITTASGGNATDFGNLTVARMAPFAGASATRGIFGQGYAFPLNSTAMDYITIASTGDAQDFGDASFRRIFSQGSASDSHGGLGGF